MKYIKFNLSNGTPVKFKVRRLYPHGLDIQWKYTDKLNFAKYIDLSVSWCMVDEKIEFLQQLDDNELIDQYKYLIEEDHIKMKNKKRTI